MRKSALGLSLLTISLSLSHTAQARLYQRDIHLITSNYDLVDTTYIDRGRLNDVKIGDKFQVKFPDGKLATQVVVTGVFERMASVKIVDRWLLKDGQTGDFNQRPMVVALERRQRRPAPDITVKTKTTKLKSAGAKDAATQAIAPAPETPKAETPAVPDAPAADGGLPAAPGAALPVAPDGGLPSAPGAALPAAPDAGGLPPAPDAGGLPPAPGAAVAPSAPAAALPPMDGGLPPAPDAGLPPAPGGAVPPAPATLPGGDPGLPPL